MSKNRLVVLWAAGSLLAGLTALGLVIQWRDDLFLFLAVVCAQGVVYLAAAWAVWDSPASRWVTLGIAAIALLLRVPTVCMPPYLSSDVYRYVWDGRVEAAGINPYRYAPADPALAPLRDTAVFPNINRAATARTIYPPAAEAIFLAVTRVWDSVTAMKAAMVGFEIVTVCLLAALLRGAGLPTARIAVYAWHPLPLWEFAGSGHIDAALIALVVAALWAIRRESSRVTGLFLALATLTKIYPAVLFPALYKRWSWAMPAVFAGAIAAAYLPFIGVGWRVFGFLPGYAGEEGFDQGGAGFYLLGLLRQVPLLGGLPSLVYVATAGIVLAVLAAAVVFRWRMSVFAAAAVLATVFTVLVSPHYAWYFAWLVVFACFVRSLALLWLTNACLLLYLIPVGSQIVRNDYRLVVESLLYVPFAALAVVDLCYHRRDGRWRG